MIPYLITIIVSELNSFSRNRIPGRLCSCHSIKYKAERLLLPLNSSSIPYIDLIISEYSQVFHHVNTLNIPYNSILTKINTTKESYTKEWHFAPVWPPVSIFDHRMIEIFFLVLLSLKTNCETFHFKMIWKFKFWISLINFKKNFFF